MIKVFEANYPESLGGIFVHKAPWIFQSVWTIIKGWLDPVVASKVHFTKDASDLAEHIDKDKIPKELGGDEDFEYEYIEPVDGENAMLLDKAGRAEVQKERAGIVDEYERETLAWINGQGDEAAHKARRSELAAELSKNYWRLDPYIRAKTLFDRNGVIGEDGEIDMYP